MPSSTLVLNQHIPLLELSSIHRTAVIDQRVTETLDLATLLAPPQKPDEIGRLGPYRVLKILGIGGMGVVFQAEDVFLSRFVALKVMLPAVAAKTSNRERFLREARITASVRHEHIVDVFSAGEDRGLPYLVMEFLDGESLDDRLKREMRLPIDELLRIGLETADGLSAAHKSNFVHRDIKPANLWIDRDSSRVKILDFGLSRMTTDNTQLTQSGVIVGTPAYMSPEQAAGLPIDFRADLFSLGAVMYRACTGELPFQAVDTMSMLNALALQTPRPIHELNRDAPASLSYLIMAMLSKNPEDRPRSARAIAETLAAIRLEQTTNVLVDLDVAPMPPVTENPVSPVEEVVKLPRLAHRQMGDLTGHTLKRFVVGPVLGRGQYGIVFRAQDCENRHTVALKVIAPEFPHGDKTTQDKEIQRYSQSVTTWMASDHPNIVAAPAAGRTGPYCWIALEFMDGGSLAQIIERFDGTIGMDWEQALRVAVHIGRALEFNRSHRIIHGNLTPRNILVRASDQTYKLNDLTLAKALRNSALYRTTLDRKLTAEVHFLSPEQADGGSSFIDHLCDLYSLGAILYVLVTGRSLYHAETVEETLDQIRSEAPVRPRKHQKSIPREFESVIMNLLAKRQEDRCSSPTALLDDLNRIAKAHRIAV